MDPSPYSKRATLSWCFYDWANSAFVLIVTSAFFPVFFKSFWNHGVDPTVSTFRLGLGTSIAGFCIALLSPLLGALADAGRAKKKFLAGFAVSGMVLTFLLAFPRQGWWLAAIALYALADIGFSGANLFYDSLIIDVAKKERLDSVSSLGYGLGYLGGGSLFVGTVIMTINPGWFGLAGTAQAIQVSFIAVGIWWLLFSLPLFFFVKERATERQRLSMNILDEGLQRLSRTAQKIAGRREIWLFLLAYWLYIDGVFTFISMAVDFGMAIGLSRNSLMIALIVVQFVGFPAALAFGALAGKAGAERMILCGIGIYTLVCFVGAPLLRTELHYIILAAVTGIAQGGVQALSRSYFAKMVPGDESAEYFGFYNLIGKASAVLGPALVGSVAFITHVAGVPSMLASRIGMASIAIFFVIGGVLLHRADVERRKRSALS
jgi:UMF1 family MFS transporter